MFTIDLLKGQGVPVKGRPEGLVVAAVTFAVPLVAAIAMFGFYLSDRIVISVKKQEIVNCQQSIDKLSEATKLQKSFEQERQLINSCLSEVASSLDSHTQWSPVLVTVAENIPDSMVLTELEAKESSIRRKIPKQDDPEIMIEVSVPVRTLKMLVSGTPQQNCDQAVRDFTDRLRLSALLAPRLEDIRISQGVGKLDGADVISYEIHCIFKPGS